MSKRPFLFGPVPPSADTLRVQVAAARSLDDLYDQLQADLALPGWFGRNLDALADVLSDLSWLTGVDRVLLDHPSVPELPPEALQGWLEVLAECVECTGGSPPHLSVAFPLVEGPGVPRFPAPVEAFLADWASES
jgi:hypothetical protein